MTTYTWTSKRGKIVTVGRAPKGGIVVGDKYYRGGQFVPAPKGAAVLLTKRTSKGGLAEVRYDAAGPDEMAVEVWLDGAKIGEGRMHSLAPGRRPAPEITHAAAGVLALTAAEAAAVRAGMRAANPALAAEAAALDADLARIARAIAAEDREAAARRRIANDGLPGRAL